MRSASEPRARSARPKLLTVPAALEIIGGSLSFPSKMPCPAWGISAKSCKRGSRLAKQPGTVCASCYALRGHYLNGSVATAHARREAALSDPRWPDAMAVLVDAYARGAYFRWFDSGDLQSLEHFDMILWVAKRTPSVAHWLPTHEAWLAGKRRSAIPANLALRVSADEIGRMPRETWGLPSSTVHREPGRIVSPPAARAGESVECLAHLRGHHCGSCRACWSPKVRNVSYLLNAGLRFLSKDTKRVHLSVVA